jgi:hypothetical protein
MNEKTELAQPRTIDPLTRGKLLPGVAGISIYMLVVCMIGVFGVFQGRYVDRNGRIAVLTVCTLVVVGVFGLLRMRRWGWALVLAGTLLLSGMYAFLSHAVHNPGMIVMAGLDLCLFLYLIRQEVRDRLI